MHRPSFAQEKIGQNEKAQCVMLCMDHFALALASFFSFGT